MFTITAVGWTFATRLIAAAALPELVNETVASLAKTAGFKPSVQFAVAVYGGYFGAGQGVRDRAVLGLRYDEALDRRRQVRKRDDLVGAGHPERRIGHTGNHARATLLDDRAATGLADGQQPIGPVAPANGQQTAPLAPEVAMSAPLDMKAMDFTLAG